MSWYALTHGFLEPDDQTHRTNVTNVWMPVRLPTAAPESRSLGAATADARWRWASPHAGCMTADAAGRDDDEYDEYVDRESVAARLHVTRELRAEMAGMAQALGRSEDDIWAEAAREWLLRRLRNDGPPPTTPAAASLPNPRTRRLWSEIDIMLAALREPRYVATSPEPTMPAA
jgi:hypothetical protein